MEQLGALSGSALPPGEFYGELLRKGLDGIDAPAGAVWIKTPQGFLQQQCQQNLAKVGLDDHPDGRQAHNQLLRLIAEKGKPGVLGPRVRADIDKSAGNPTDYALALAPILTEDNQTLGLVEIFQKPNWHPQDLVTYRSRSPATPRIFCEHSSNRKVAGQEAVWTQLEVFSRQVHGSLNPTEVAYTVANEGRRLIGCDRITRRHPARPEDDHRGRQRGRRGREGEHAHPPDARPVRLRHPVGREARLPRAAATRPCRRRCWRPWTPT